MFQTVRHWWSAGRGRVTFRLFAFEFLVVVAGVLVAQALAGYAQQRSDLTRMEMERSRVRYELESAHSMFQSWSFAVPCLNRRMTEIMSGNHLSSHDLHRPSMPTPNYSAPDSFTLNLIAQRYGIEEKNLLKSVADQIASITMRDEMIISAWGHLALLDPANGPFSDSDRTQARIAAAEIKGHLRSIEVMTDSSLESLRRLRIPAHNHDENTAPATSCAAIWQSGRLDPPIAAS